MVIATNVLTMVGRLQESADVARLVIKSARERKDLDSLLIQQCMRNYAEISYSMLQGPVKESKQLLEELLARQTRLYGPHAPQMQETMSAYNSLLKLSHFF